MLFSGDAYVNGGEQGENSGANCSKQNIISFTRYLTGLYN